MPEIINSLDESNHKYVEPIINVIKNMWYPYLDDFRRGISVFAIFSYSIVVLDTLQCPPHIYLN